MVKFGIYIPQSNVDYQTVKMVALECERWGSDSAWICDHLVSPFGPPNESYLECWTTLSALTAVTTKLRLGTLVLCNLFRHPSVLAKMAATLDVISNGRLEFGMGLDGLSRSSRPMGYTFRGLPYGSPSFERPWR